MAASGYMGAMTMMLVITEKIGFYLFSVRYYLSVLAYEMFLKKGEM